MKNETGGFTIIEVLIAIIILSIGVLALSSGAGSVTRMMYSGQNKTNAYAQAASKLDSLRAAARGACAIAGGSWGPLYGVTGSWTVTNATSSRQIEIIASYRNGPQLRADTLFATVHCP